MVILYQRLDVINLSLSNLGSDDISSPVLIQSDESSEILEYLTQMEVFLTGLCQAIQTLEAHFATPSSVCITSPDMQSADSDMDYSNTTVSALNRVQDLSFMDESPPTNQPSASIQQFHTQHHPH